MNKIDLTGLSPEVIAYINSLETKLEQQSQQVAKLTTMLQNLQKSMYGQSSEKSKYILDQEQISLFNEAEVEYQGNAPEPEPVQVAGYSRKPKRTKEELAANLPVVDVLCELEPVECVCPNCSGNLRPLGKEKVREELQYIPAQMQVNRYFAQSYVCTACEKETGQATIVKAPVPQPVIKKSMASASTVAHVMYEKYVNAMPLHRQEKNWANQGVILSRATLANWVIKGAQNWLLPIWERLKEHLLRQVVIHADETVLQVLKEKGKKPTSDSRMWVYASGNTGASPIVLYEYQPTRSGEHARRFLEGFSGYLQTDGYGGYEKVRNVKRCGCWAHLRRKYQEAMPKEDKLKDSAAAIGFQYCSKLFEIENELKDLRPEERLQKRQELCKPLLEAYLAWLKTVDALKGSKLGEAITYSQKQWETLTTFLEDGRIEISNNKAENAIRPFVLGRKNWLFADTPRGANASAVVYSIIETAKVNKLNPYMYLVHLFTKMPSLDFKNDPSVIEDLLPWSSKLPPYCYVNQ